MSAGLIALIEDDDRLRKATARTLEAEGFGVLGLAGAEEALAELASVKPDLVLSDVRLGGMDGMELCRRIRRDPRLAAVPVILLSGARIETEDQVEGIDGGADDYLLKPVPSKLLIARVKAVLRRYAAPGALASVLRAEGLELDVRARTVTVAGKIVALTRKEFDFLTLLLNRRGEVLTHQYLLDSVWGIDPASGVDTETLKTHASTLRVKLGKSIGDKLVSVRGVGYAFRG